MGARLRRGVVAAAAALGCAALGLLRPEAVQALDVERLRVAAAALGPRAEAGARELLALLQRLATADEVAKAREINDFYNRRIRYGTDQEVWNQRDYWASPLQTLEKGRGDCEDYAIAKYFSLLAVGVQSAKLRMVYVKVDRAATATQAAVAGDHMVLAYYAQPTADPLILDNLEPELRPASLRPDLRPVFSFNTEGSIWDNLGQTTKPDLKISVWRDAMARVKAEGF